MEQLVHYFMLFNEYSKSNPIIAGIVSLWGVGVATWFLRNLPSHIFSFFKRQLTTSVVLDSTTTGDNYEVFLSFLSWINQSKWVKFSRTLMMIGTYSGNYKLADGTDMSSNAITQVLVSIGAGKHFFFYNGRPFVIDLTVEKAALNYNKIYTANITTFGRDHSVILKMLDEFRMIKDDGDISIYNQNGENEWRRVKNIKPRNLDTVIVNKAIKADIIKDIQTFLDSRQWYLDRGIPYKRVYVLHGPSGTGKTSLVKALAGYFNKNIYAFKAGSLSDRSFSDGMSSVRSNGFALIEDFDSNNGFKARSSMKAKLIKQKTASRDVVETATPSADSAQPTELSSLFEKLSLSTILNVLDGISPIDGLIIFLSTNDLSSIDSAILRTGRCDYIVEIPHLGDEEIHDYIKLMFPENGSDFKDIHFTPISGSDVQALYMENRNDIDAFVKSLCEFKK